jgi:hypothetical protein
MFKKIITSIVLCTMMLAALSITAFAAEHTIGTCPTTDPGSLCDKLQNIYGSASTVKYSTSETAACKYATSVSVNGVQTTVYLSAKPTTGDVGVQMGDDGKLVIDGINSDTTGNNAQPDPSVITAELIRQITHVVKYEEGMIHPFIESAYPYNQINEKFVYAYGTDCATLRYFLDDDMDDVKAFLKENSIDVKAFLNEHFYKVKVNIGLQTKTVYVTIEPTKDQKTFLKSEANGLTMVDVPSNDASIGEIFIVLILLVNTAAVGGLFYFLVWRKKENFM